MKTLGLAVLAALAALTTGTDQQYYPDQETAETEVRPEEGEAPPIDADLGDDLGHGYGFAIHTEHSEQYAERDDGLGHGQDHDDRPVKRVVITKAVPYDLPFPVPVEKRVPYPVKVPVQVPMPVAKPYEVTVLKPYTVPVDRAVPYIVEKPVAVPVKVAVKVPVAHPEPYEVSRPYTVPVAVAKPYKVFVPVYVRSKEHGIKGDYPHVKYTPTQPEPPQPQQPPQRDHHAGYSELRETYDPLGGPGAFASTPTSASDLDARLAELRSKGGSYSYVYRH